MVDEERSRVRPLALGERRGGGGHVSNTELKAHPTYEPNPALRVLNRWFFDKIQVDEEWVERVREVSGRGTVVYILRSLNLLDYLALDHLTKRFDLPRIRYVNDLQ